jgi:ribosome-associated protein
MIEIKPNLYIPESELQFTYIASPGPGGQNVNKVATAVQLKFNVLHSPTLPEEIRQRILMTLGKKLTNQGELVIKAYRYRSQERNKEDAINRLIAILHHSMVVPKKRVKTKPTKNSVKRRLESKKAHSEKKAIRSKTFED